MDLSKGLRPGYTYNEKDWNPITYDEAVTADGTTAYCASKKLAERAAWDYMANHPSSNFSLATVCPPMIYGPLEHNVHLNSLNASSQDIYRLINGSEKKIPEATFIAWVDVRDAAVAHVRALEAPPKKGVEDRYLVTAGPFSYLEICNIINKRFPHLVNSGLTPNPAGAPAPPPHYRVDNSKSTTELNMSYRTLEACIVDVVHSLLKLQKDESEPETAAPISVTDVRTGQEQRSHTLVGTGLTVCGCEGNMGVCSCPPSTCACRGCAKKSSTNPTARTAHHGPKPGQGVVPVEWKQTRDLPSPPKISNGECKCAKKQEDASKCLCLPGSLTCPCTGHTGNVARGNCDCPMTPETDAEATCPVCSRSRPGTPGNGQAGTGGLRADCVDGFAARFGERRGKGEEV